MSASPQPALTLSNDDIGTLARASGPWLAVVSSDDSYLSHGGGASSSIWEASGASDARLAGQPIGLPAPLASVVQTDPGMLNASALLHAITIDLDRWRRIGPDEYASMFEALAVEVQRLITEREGAPRRLLMAVIGTGAGGIPEALAAEAFEGFMVSMAAMGVSVHVTGKSIGPAFLDLQERLAARAASHPRLTGLSSDLPTPAPAMASALAIDMAGRFRDRLQQAANAAARISTPRGPNKDPADAAASFIKFRCAQLQRSASQQATLEAVMEARREAIRREGVGETLSQVADAAVPFGGLLMKIAKSAMEQAKDRMSAARSFEQAEAAANRTLVDEVCECVHALVDGAGGLSTVLWLDDAQWSDAETQEFVRRLWLTAQRRQWPLLLVVTHWEREWRELKRSVDGEAIQLTSLEGHPGVQVRVLPSAPAGCLAGFLQSRLPGLTPPQRTLMLQKAAGNFLTMVENVGQLMRMPPNFVNRDTSGPLSPAGERKVQEWESDSQKRVEQRVSDLAPELQELLGWGSHLGMSFLREVVEDFAERVAGQQGAGARLAEAVDPLVILGQPSEHLREFRDKAFHHVAARHFRDYGQEHAEALDRILRERLVEWVNNSFDANGDEIWSNAEQGIQAPPCSVTGLSNEEARDVLGMAVSHLQVPAEPDWSDPVTATALRATFLLVVVDRRENLWDRVREHCKSLSAMDWTVLPKAALSPANLGRFADQAETAGALQTALGLRAACLVEDRRLAEELGTPESRRDVRVSLFFLIRATNQTLDSADCSEPRRAAVQVEASLRWVLEFEQAPDHNSSSADTLAAWWEHAHAVTSAMGDAASAAESLARVGLWRDRQHALRAAEPDHDGTPPTDPS